MTAFTAPRGAKLRDAMIESRVVEAVEKKLRANRPVTREFLCSLIGVDGSPLSSDDFAIRTAFLYWFHQYLRKLRSALVSAGVPVLLEYPDAENNKGEATKAGHGVALVKFDGADAAAFLLHKTMREQLRQVRRVKSRMALLVGESPPYVRGHSKEVVMRLAENLERQVELSQSTTTLLLGSGLASLPSLGRHFKDVQ